MALDGCLLAVVDLEGGVLLVNVIMTVHRTAGLGSGMVFDTKIVVGMDGDIGGAAAGLPIHLGEGQAGRNAILDLLVNS